MGFLQSIVGSNTGAGFLAKDITPEDVANSKNQIANQQAQQQQLYNALNGQNGVANQSNVFNQQQQLLAQQAGVNGVGNQQSALQSQQALAGQQQGLAQQYQDLSNGVGPNPAQAQLAQNTAENVAQTGALMAGQRGAAQNVGLLARQAGQQGAATQQAAVGQAATLQAQQQIAAMQGLQAQQQAIGATNQSVAGIAGNQVGQQQAQQTNAANLATQQVGQQLSASQQAANTALGSQSNDYGLLSNQNTTNAGIAAGNQKSQAGLIGGILGSAGAASATAGARGGEVRRFAAGGTAGPMIQTPNAYIGPQNNGPQSYIGKYFAPGYSPTNQDNYKSGFESGQGLYNLGKKAYNWLSGPQTGKALGNEIGSDIGGEAAAEAAGAAGEAEAAGAAADAATAGEAVEGVETASAAGEGLDSLVALAARGGQIQGGSQIDAGVKIEKGYSPKEPDPSTIGGILGTILEANGGMAKAGGPVRAANPNQKAVKAGNSYANDKIPALLSEGEVVIPRNVMQSTDPVRNAASFVRDVLAKRKARAN